VTNLPKVVYVGLAATVSPVPICTYRMSCLNVLMRNSRAVEGSAAATVVAQ